MTCAIAWLSRGLRLARRFDMRMRSGRDGDEIRKGWEDASLTFRARMFGYGSGFQGFRFVNGALSAHFGRTWVRLPKIGFQQRLCQLLVFRGRAVPASDFVPDISFAQKQSSEDSIMRIVLLAAVPLLMATMAHAAVQSNDRNCTG